MSVRFEEVIDTRERLRSFVKEPNHRVRNKVIDHIDDICARFIAASPFVVIASRGMDDVLDLSPRGDPPGFVAVVDEKTIVIPDRLGNNRTDTFENLLVHPEIGLLFMIPGHGDTLRVSGTGRIVRDASLQAALSVAGKAPNLLLAVTVERAFLHCAKSTTRSHLWQPERWPDRTRVASLAEAMVAHGKLEETVAEMQGIVETDYRSRLY